MDGVPGVSLAGIKAGETFTNLHPVLAPCAWIGHTLHVGKVVVKIKLTNQGDLVAARRKLSKAKPRTVEAEALVDTGATRLYLQSNLIKALGLHKESEVQSKTTNGVRRRAVFEPVRLELVGRNGLFQVVEMDDAVKRSVRKRVRPNN
jgi:predicted aspartyl protease